MKPIFNKELSPLNPNSLITTDQLINISTLKKDPIHLLYRKYSISNIW